jgi:hypothetical protein
LTLVNIAKATLDIHALTDSPAAIAGTLILVFEWNKKPSRPCPMVTKD